MGISSRYHVRLWTAGNGKREGGAWTIVGLRPEAATMSFDDGAADGEPDAHAVALRRIESVKQLVHALAVDADAGIPHAHTHTIAGIPFGSDQHVPRAIVDTEHRVRGVAHEVQDDLLDLDPIAGDGRKILGELRPKYDPVPPKVAQRQRDD